MTDQLEWTYDRPTAPGWYWAIVAGAPEVVHVAFPYPGEAGSVLSDHAGHLLVWITDEDGPERLTRCYGWQWWPEAIQAPSVATRADYVGP